MPKPNYERALIVGAGSGLSASLARLFAREGLKVSLAARNGILLIDTCRRLGAGAPLSQQSLLVGGGSRLRATITLATAVTAGFLPLVFLGNVAGLEILHPMAISVIGGLVTSTLVTLFVVPLLYLGETAQNEVKVSGVEENA